MRNRLQPWVAYSVVLIALALSTRAPAEEPKAKLNRIVPDGVYADKNFIASLYEVIVADGQAASWPLPSTEQQKQFKIGCGQ